MITDPEENQEEGMRAMHANKEHLTMVLPAQGSRGDEIELDV